MFEHVLYLIYPQYQRIMGVVFSDCSAFVDSHCDRVNDNARKQMKHTQPGASAAKWKAYNAKYGMQASQIIEGFTMVAGAEDHVETNSTAPATRQRNVTKKKGPDVEDAGTPREVKRVPGMLQVQLEMPRTGNLA
jgi:hypothetical protein